MRFKKTWMRFTLLNNFKSFNMFYYTYILKSEKDGKFYTGYTKDLKLRLEEHNKGKVPSTKERAPLILVYYEAALIEVTPHIAKNI